MGEHDGAPNVKFLGGRVFKRRWFVEAVERGLTFCFSRSLAVVLMLGSARLQPFQDMALFRVKGWKGKEYWKQWITKRHSRTILLFLV